MKLNLLNKKLILISLLLILSISLMSVAIFANADDYTFVADDIKTENLVVGDEINIPAGKFGTVKANTYIIYPDGTSAYNLDKLTINSHGEYIVKYSVVIGGKTYTEEKSFSVTNDLYTFSGNRVNSSASYGKNELTDRTGLLAKIAQGDVFNFNEVIDLRETNVLSPAVALTFVPNVIGGHDAQNIILTFTDAYDTNNKVQIKLRISTGAAGTTHWSNCQARANDQVWAGYDYSRATRVTRIGSPYSTQLNTYACDSTTEIVGQTVYNITDIFKKQHLKFWIDVETNIVYANYCRFKDNAIVTTELIDLDDMSYQTASFGGFTTGEVFLSVSAEMYSASTANLLFTAIGQSDLSNQLVDEKPASIDVDFGEYTEETIPNGSVGYSYPVFDAQGYDVYSGGMIDCEARVFYGYTRKAGVYNDLGGRYSLEINVKDGRFATPYIGNYSICYRTKLYDGSILERVVNVYVGNIVKPLDEVTFGEPIISGKVGNIITIPNAISYGGGTGKANVDITVKDSDGNVEFAQGNALRGYWFVPEKVGNYAISYTAKDFVGNEKIAEYTVNVTANANASFNKPVELPEYFIADTNYVLPEYYATNYQTNEEVLASIKYVDSKGEKNYTNGSKVKFTGEEVTIKYICGDNVLEVTRPIITVKDASNKNALMLDKYFIPTQSVVVNAESSGLRLTATDDGQAQFIRDLVDRDLSMEATITNLGKDFDSFSIIFTDSIDKNIFVKVSLVSNGKSVDLWFNGKKVVNNYATNLVETLRIVVSYNNKTISFNTGNQIVVQKTSNGDDFYGFPSGKMYLTYCLEEVKTTSSVLVSKIKTQRLNSGITTDTTKPIIYMNGDYGSLVCEINKEVDILSVVTDDVLSGYTSVVLSVEWDYQSIESSVDGILFDGVDATQSYKFKPTKEGVYYITYTATDWNNKKESATYKLVVIDDIAPKITVNKKLKVKGSEITLPRVTATDNSGEVTVIMSVTNPDGYTTIVKNGVYQATKSGEHTVVVSAMDKQGNTTTLVYNVKVK